MTQVEFTHAVVQQMDVLKLNAIHLTHDKENAKDLLQTTMLKALSNRDKFASGTNLRAWLYTIMRNTFLSDRTQKANKYQYVDLNVADRLETKSFHDGESKLMLNCINERISLLRESLRIPFLMHYQGYKYKEIAEILGISIDNVKVRIHFARKDLQSTLQGVKTAC